MSWAIGFDERWQRDIGYGVPCVCDHPHCNKEIDRGLAHVCGADAYGGEHGCGLFFCEEHHLHGNSRRHSLCIQCFKGRKPFTPKPDLLRWTYFKMTDPSWEEWRKSEGLTPEAVSAK
jgi:hypothetical protein